MKKIYLLFLTLLLSLGYASAETIANGLVIVSDGVTDHYYYIQNPRRQISGASVFEDTGEGANLTQAVWVAHKAEQLWKFVKTATDKYQIISKAGRTLNVTSSSDAVTTAATSDGTFKLVEGTVDNVGYWVLYSNDRKKSINKGNGNATYSAYGNPAADDAGNAVQFISENDPTFAGDKLLKLGFGNILLGSSPVETFNVYGYNLTAANVTAIVEGTDDSVFSASAVTLTDATGGKKVSVDVTFTPNSDQAKAYSATLVIGGGGAATAIRIPLSGSTVPVKVSADATDHYYYIHTPRRIISGNSVLEDKGEGAEVAQSALTIGNNAQLWKFVKASSGNKYQIVGKSGLKINKGSKITASTESDLAFSFNAGTGDNPGYWELYDGVAGINKEGSGTAYGAWEGSHTNDVGNALQFISDTDPTFAATDVIKVSATAFRNDPATLKISNITGYNLSGDVTVSITGTDADAFSAAPTATLTDLPIGKKVSVDVAFTGTTAKTYNATLTLSQAGAQSFNIPLSVNVVEAPVVRSTNDDEHWYQIKFNSGGDKSFVQDAKIGSNVTPENDAKPLSTQYWKFVGSSLLDLKIVSYAGHEIGSASKFTSVNTGEGNSFKLEASSTAGKWVLTANTGAFSGKQMNREASAITGWDSKDGNSVLEFITATPAVEYAVTPATTATENSLDFETVAVGTPVTKTITVAARNLVGADVIAVVDGIEADIAAFTITKAEGWSDKRGGTINVEFAPTTNATYNATVTITANSESKEIALTGTGTVDPIIYVDGSISNKTVDFGNVTTTKISLPKTIVVSGNYLGEGTITKAVAGADADAFTIDATDWTAETGGALKIVFKPTTIKDSYTATVTIATENASPAPTPIVVTLSGKGVAEPLTFVSTETTPTWYFLQTVDGNPWNDFVTDETTVSTKPYHGLTDAQQWQVLATDTTNQYLLKSKAGNYLGYEAADFAPVALASAKTFDLEASNNNWKIKYNAGDNYVKKAADTNNSTLQANALGSEFAFVTPTTAVDKLPIISTSDTEYWYQIKNYATNSQIWNNDAGKVTKVDPASTETATYWKFVESANGYKIVNYDGTELKGYSGEWSITVAAGEGNEYNFEWRELTGNKSASLQRWAMRNYTWSRYGAGAGSSDQRYICDGSAQWSYGAGDDAGRTFEFVLAKPETVADSTQVRFEATEVSQSATASVTVSGINLLANVSYSVTEATPFTVTEGTSWTDAAGGELVITFTPTAVGNASATLTISSDGVEAIEIALTGTSFEIPNNVATVDATTVNVYAKGTALYVETATAQSVKIYNVSGVVVFDQTVEGKVSVPLTKGVYAVKTDTVTKKVIL
ncbi:MAG: hypothetical protein EZS26_001509 [Candidatus Ordinivivax streblomastigis]|uniref:Uncharacterized protein n=1 Tax=Candidatus Ordinivivax streblomastigis TaxID=2540710 RepID=A0A5M8P234_9BACT|nr:MAG: hypothetical protein EZS26_001509 [Candidatus Ordinivivax streblomastigis]